MSMERKSLKEKIKRKINNLHTVETPLKKLPSTESKIKNLASIESNIKNASKVFIVGHNEPDCDSIGAALGLSVIAQHFGKETYIIVNDNELELAPDVKALIDNNKKEHTIITLDSFRRLVDDNSLLMVADVNKKYLVSVKDDLDKFKDIIVIDHHLEDANTIPATKKLIDPKISSASEIVARLLNMSQIKYNKDVGNALLAGIILDTKRFYKNTTSTTLDVAEKLIRHGAEYDVVNRLFLSNFYQDQDIYMLMFDKPNGKTSSTIGNTHIQLYPRTLLQESTVSFTLNRNAPTTIYKKVDLAKAADKMLKYADVAFVLGYINEEEVSISARSKSDINVGKIMGRIENGGGNGESAGGRVKTEDILAFEQDLMQLVQWGIPDFEEDDKPKELLKRPEEARKRKAKSQ